jgi:hypothetical protein
MATVRNVQIAVIEKYGVNSICTGCLLGNINTITVETMLLCLYDHKYMQQNNKARHFSSVIILLFRFAINSYPANVDNMVSS